MADISTGRQRGIVPFVDETTGRLPDQYLPQLEIGGTNLLQYTAYENLNGVYVRGSAATASVDSNDKVEGRSSLKLEVPSASSSGTKDIWQRMWGSLTVGDHITLSFWAKGSVEAKMWCRTGGSIVNNGFESPGDPRALTITQSWQYYTVDLGVCHSLVEGVTEGELIYGFGSAGTFHINGMKLERGTKATDWSPAPKDFDGKYTSKTEFKQTISNYVPLSTYRALETRVQALEAKLPNQ